MMARPPLTTTTTRPDDNVETGEHVSHSSASPHTLYLTSSPHLRSIHRIVISQLPLRPSDQKPDANTLWIARSAAIRCHSVRGVSTTDLTIDH